jgi:hypothetical protein
LSELKAVKEYVALVAPLIVVQLLPSVLFFHVSVGVGVPAAVTVSVTV